MVLEKILQNPKSGFNEQSCNRSLQPQKFSANFAIDVLKTFEGEAPPSRYSAF
jgi:hypothetical protein